MNKIFNFSTPQSIFMGIDALKELPGQIKRLGGKKVFILTDEGVCKAGILDNVKGVIEKKGYEVGYYDKVIPEPPIDTVEKIAEIIRDNGFDILVGLGGGSSIDVTKVVSILVTNGGPIDRYIGVDLVEKPGIPTIMLPTTSGTGSEVTPIAILTDTKDKLKKGIVSPYLYASVAIVDPILTISVPPKITANTGMDALVHAIESYIGKKANPFTECLSLKAIRLISENLRTAVTDCENIEARYNMSLGSLLAGIAFANAGVGAVHALAYPLGGQFHLPHGLSNTLMLRYVMEYNIVSRLDKFAKIAEAMGENIKGLSIRDAAQLALDAMVKLAEDINVPTKLRQVEIPKEAIPQLAEAGIKVTRLLSNNPRKLSLEDIIQIYTNAW
jgi:alcohol dehydrogenase class IV